MYVPTPFRVEDEGVLFDAVERWPFGLLIDTDIDGAPAATQLPFVVDRTRRCLVTHLAAANPQAGRIDGARVLAVFRGPHAAVSPEELGEPERNVPTWNYVAVQVTGRARRLDGGAALAALDGAVQRHSADGWRRSRLDHGLRLKLEGAIAVIAVDVEHMTGAWKLSQNKPPAMQRRLRARLRERGGDAARLAALMGGTGESDAPVG